MDWIKAKEMLSKFTILLLVIGLTAAAIISAILQIVNFEEESLIPTRDPLLQDSMAVHDGLVIGNTIEHTMWFMQISDIHLSIYFDPKRKTDFYKFCTEVVDTVKPTLVLATGDLTDARTLGPMGSTQHEEEWQMYSEVLRDSNITSKTTWLDIRGNHDDFNVYNWSDGQNFYKKYSIQGPHHKSHYSHTVNHGLEQYTFIGVDACLEPGPKRPFNFVGILHEEDIAILDQMKRNASSSTMTFWFGHYPTSSVASPKYGLREVINGPYFCGHYHMTDMYVTQASGFLEVEVADFRAKRKFRVAAVDHGIFVFNDVILNKWPIILITNPKPTMYSMPKYEPLGRIRNSTHIRALVWSKAKLLEVKMKINDGAWIVMNRVDDGPLYAAAWEPSKYENGLYMIAVHAADEEDNEQSVSHQFSLDGTRPPFPARARFVLRLAFETFAKLVFFSVVLFCVTPLMTLRLLDYIGKGRWLRLRPSKSRLNGIVSRFYLLACCNSLFLPAIAIPLYATFGPWFVGQPVDGHWGICFIWGMYIDGAHLPGGFTYIMAVLFLLFVHAPLMATLAHILHCRYNELVTGNRSVGTFKTFCHVRNFVVSLLLLIHFFLSLTYANAYGMSAWIFGFLNTWTLFVYLFMWRRAMRAEVDHFLMTARPRVAVAHEEKREDTDLLEGDEKSDVKTDR